MDAFIYKGDLYCTQCAGGLIPSISIVKISSDDSEDAPQGPYSDGGGEADYPQHCGSCGEFLENPLTEDGIEYVKQAIEDGTGNAAILAQWKEFYL